jgi:hypothetical protein
MNVRGQVVVKVDADSKAVFPENSWHIYILTVLKIGGHSLPN